MRTIIRYIQASNKDKNVVKEVKLKVYDDFYTKLDGRDGEKNIYRLAKMIKRGGEKRDFT